MRTGSFPLVFPTLDLGVRPCLFVASRFSFAWGAFRLVARRYVDNGGKARTVQGDPGGTRYEDPRWGGDETLALTTDPGCKMSRPAQEELDREFGSTSALACSLGSTNLSNEMGVEQSLRTH